MSAVARRRSWETGEAQDHLRTYQFVLIGTFIAGGITVTSLALFIGRDGTQPLRSIEMIHGVNTEITHCAFLNSTRITQYHGVYLILVSLFGFIFSFLIRNFSDTITGSRVLAGVIVLSLIVYVLSVQLTASLNYYEHISYYAITRTVGLSVVVFIGLSSLLFPPYFKVMIFGDENATKAVVDEFVDAVTGNSNRNRVVPLSDFQLENNAVLDSVNVLPLLSMTPYAYESDEITQ
jgi:hypothetical protein